MINSVARVTLEGQHTFLEAEEIPGCCAVWSSLSGGNAPENSCI